MCGCWRCEAEPVIATLMADHGAPATPSNDMVRAPDAGARDAGAVDDSAVQRSGELTALLAELIDCHASKRQPGLFFQFRQTADAPDELAGRESERHRLRAGLSHPLAVEDPEGLRPLTGELFRHAGEEQADLFAFARQVLPNQRWASIEAVRPELFDVLQ